MTAPEGPSAVLPWPLRPPRRVAGVPVGLLVCWQAAFLLALVAIGRPTGHVIILGVAAAALIAVTGYRPRGRWAHEWVALRLRYLFRSLRVAKQGEPPELALLDLAGRVEAIEPVEMEGREVATIVHATGGTAVLELDLDELRPELGQLPLTLAPHHEHDPDAPAICVQLVLHTTPGSPARAWLAVQVRREPGFPNDELRGALVSAVRRLQRRLRTTGLHAPALDRAQLRDALRVATHLALAGPIPSGDPGGVGTEQWRRWWTGGVPQASLAIRQWSGTPESPGATLFHTLLTPQWPQTVSIAAQRVRVAAGHGAVGAGTDALAVELMARVAGRDRATVEAALRELRDRLTRVGARVERLDGRQLPGFAATLPLGGFLPGYAPSAAAFAPPPKATRPGREQPAAPVEPVRAAPQPAVPAPPQPPLPVPQPFHAPPPAPTPQPAEAAQPTEAPQPAPTPQPTPTPQPAEAAQPAPTPQPAPAPPPVAQPLRARATAQIPAPLPPVQGRAGVPATPTAPPGVPTALRGAATPPPPPATGAPAPPSHLDASLAPHPLPPDPHHAVRAYGASLFTAESPHRSWTEQLVALARTPHSAPRAVAVLAGKDRVGASTTAEGVARTLATVRDDQTALLSVDAGSASPSAIMAAAHQHTFIVVDLGTHTGEATPQAIALSQRVLLVTNAGRDATGTTRLILDRIEQVHPALVETAVIAAVCATTRQYRRMLRELGDDLTPQAAQIVPIPYDPALRTTRQLDLTRLRMPTREAYLRLAASLAASLPAAAPTDPARPHTPTHSEEHHGTRPQPRPARTRLGA